MEDLTPRQSSLRRTALTLVWVGLLWNVAEAVLGLWSGVEARSVALVAFGLDSLVELFAGGVLIWHLSTGWKGEVRGDSERKAHRLLGITFLVLAAYVAVQSSATLLGWWPNPRISFIGIALIAASALVMSVLYVRKTAVTFGVWVSRKIDGTNALLYVVSQLLGAWWGGCSSWPPSRPPPGGP